MNVTKRSGKTEEFVEAKIITCAERTCVGIEDDDPTQYKFAPPTSGTTEERELPP